MNAAASDQTTRLQREILASVKRQGARSALNVRVDHDVAGPTCRIQIDRSAATRCHCPPDGFRSTRNQKDISISRCRDSPCRRKRSGVCDRDVATRLGDPGDAQRKAIHKANVAGRCVRRVETRHLVCGIQQRPCRRMCR